MYPLDKIRIDPLTLNQCTVAGTSAKIRHMGGDFTILCQAGFCATVHGLSAASTIADLSCTDAGNAISFAVVEATAASAAGSAISGATLDLGPSTVAVSRGMVMGMIQVTSNLTTADNLTVNGIAYRTATTGPGRDGSAVATEVAAVLNGETTRSQKILHYTAVANDLATGLITIRPDDDLGTGLTIEATAGDATYVIFPAFSQGKINVKAARLSTNSPKFIGVTCGESSGVVTRAVSMVRFPSGADAFPGAVVTTT